MLHQPDPAIGRLPCPQRVSLREHSFVNLASSALLLQTRFPPMAAAAAAAPLPHSSQNECASACMSDPGDDSQSIQQLERFWQYDRSATLTLAATERGGQRLEIEGDAEEGSMNVVRHVLG